MTENEPCAACGEDTPSAAPSLGSGTRPPGRGARSSSATSATRGCGPCRGAGEADGGRPACHRRKRGMIGIVSWAEGGF